VTGFERIGTGSATGVNRATEAALRAVSSLELEESIRSATAIEIEIAGGANLGLFEVNEVAEVVTRSARANVDVTFGAVIDEKLADQLRVTVCARFGGSLGSSGSA
jgi:cell division protein FtsZ